MSQLVLPCSDHGSCLGPLLLEFCTIFQLLTHRLLVRCGSRVYIPRATMMRSSESFTPPSGPWSMQTDCGNKDTHPLCYPQLLIHQFNCLRRATRAKNLLTSLKKRKKTDFQPQASSRDNISTTNGDLAMIQRQTRIHKWTMILALYLLFWVYCFIAYTNLKWFAMYVFINAIWHLQTIQ